MLLESHAAENNKGTGIMVILNVVNKQNDLLDTVENVIDRVSNRLDIFIEAVDCVSRALDHADRVKELYEELNELMDDEVHIYLDYEWRELYERRTELEEIQLDLEYYHYRLTNEDNEVPELTVDQLEILDKLIAKAEYILA